MSKKRARDKKTSIEDIYRNKHFVPPKEQNLETIFEEPRQSKDGVPILTSVKKYKRYLHFDSTQNKIQKRKKKAKKCLQKLKNDYRITRSSPKSSKCDDISLYILDVLGESSNDSDMDVTKSTVENKTLTNTLVTADLSSKGEACPSSSQGLLYSDSYNSLKSYDGTRSLKLQTLEDGQSEKTTENFGEPSTISIASDDPEKPDSRSEDVHETESPRRSCCIS